MRPPRRIIQTYGMSQSHKLGSTLRVDVVTALRNELIAIVPAVTFPVPELTLMFCVPPSTSADPPAVAV